MMINKNAFMEMALSFPNSEEVKHFDRIGIKVKGRRMFSTYLESNNTANIFLAAKEQKIFCKMDSQNIYPVPNKWGEKGATTFELNTVEKGIVLEALLSAYNNIVKSNSKRR